MWNEHTYTYTHTPLSTNQAFYCYAVLQCRQVASHHLTSGEASFLEGIEMPFWNGREGGKTKGQHQEKGGAV